MQEGAARIALALVISLAVPSRGTAPAPEPSKRGSSFSVYTSADHGLSWSKVGAGLPASGRINALAVDGAWAFAGTDDGLFVSRDAGRTWSASLTTGAARVQSLLAAEGRIHAGTRSAGVLVSDDAGRMWRPMNEGLTDRNVRSLAAQGPLIYAGTDEKGVFLLRNGRWAPLDGDLPPRAQVFDLAATDGWVYAALYANGLHRARAGSRGWERVGDVTPLEVVARGANLIAGYNPGGIRHSADAGATWRRAAGLPGRAPIWVLGEAGPNVLAGTSPCAIVVSSDRGASWRPGNTGLPPHAAVIAVAGSSAYTLVAIVE